MLLVDMSGSQFFGSQTSLKRDIAAELSAILAFSAMKNNDKVGAILFTDQIEKFIPPRKGRSHALRIVRELLSFEPRRQNNKSEQRARIPEPHPEETEYRVSHFGFHGSVATIRPCGLSENGTI